MKQDNLTQISTSNTLGIIAFSLSLISLVVPFLLGGFLIIGSGIILGLFGLRKSPKGLAIAGIIISIGSLLISPTFWLYLAGLSLNQQANIQAPKQTQLQNQNVAKTVVKDKTKIEEELTMEELQAQLDEFFTPKSPISREILTFAIVKQADGSYNFYPSVLQMKNKENVDKAFSLKGIDSSKVKINIMNTDRRTILEVNSIERSKDTIRMKEFLDLYKDLKLDSFVNDNFEINIVYPITFEILDKYKDVITELNNYSGFYPQFNSKEKKKISFAIVRKEDGTYDYYSNIYNNTRDNTIKDFSQKGLNVNEVKINYLGINYRAILETNAIEQSKNPKRLQEFLELYKERKLNMGRGLDSVTNVEYPITFEILDKYKDVISELNEYSGFYPQLVTQ